MASAEAEGVFAHLVRVRVRVEVKGRGRGRVRSSVRAPGEG